MNIEEFYIQFPGVLIPDENKGYLNLGYCQFTEFQYFPSTGIMEVAHCMTGELTDEVEMKFEEYLQLINILKQTAK